MTIDEAFGECRSLLAGQPSTELFEAICDCVEPFLYNDEFEPLLEYLLSRVASWPERVLRPAPHHWLMMLSIEGFAQAFHLCNAVDVQKDTDIDWMTMLAYAPPLVAAHLTDHWHLDEFINFLDWCGHAEALRELTIAHCDDRLRIQEGLGQLSGSLTGLRRLDLRYNDLDNDDLKALVERDDLAQLRELYLQHNRIQAEGVKALGASSHMRHLEILDLRYNMLDLDGVEALAQSPHLRSLRWLYLNRNDMPEQGRAILAASPYLHPSIRLYWKRVSET